MPKAVLLADAIAWHDEDDLRHEADGRGTEVDLPADAFDRHKKAGNVAAAGSKAAKSAGEPEAETVPGE